MQIGNTVFHINMFVSDLSLNLRFIRTGTCEFSSVANLSKDKTLNFRGLTFYMCQLEILVSI